MANVRIVLAQGLVDGINRVFATGEPYVPGTTAYILNGRIHNQKTLSSAFGYVELDPDAGTIEVDVAPEIDDVVQIFYWSRVVLPPPVVDRLSGIIGAREQVHGVIREPATERLVGVVAAKQVQGVIRDATPERLTGVVGVQRVTGVIREKCP